MLSEKIVVVVVYAFSEGAVEGRTPLNSFPNLINSILLTFQGVGCTLYIGIRIPTTTIIFILYIA